MSRWSFRGPLPCFQGPGMAPVECAILNTGASIPLVGLGTGSDGPLSLEDGKAAILAAIEVGYRHFDTAMIYGSEGFLGEALKDAMKADMVKREDLFVTSKLWSSDAYPEGVLPALRKSLSGDGCTILKIRSRKDDFSSKYEYIARGLFTCNPKCEHFPPPVVSALQLDYLDLYLIHWPIRFKEGTGLHPEPDDLMPLDMRGTWRALEACVRQGLTKAIGVSNFSSKKILDLLEFAEIPPAVNQVEMHPKWQQKPLRATCKSKNIQVCAWSPLGAPLLQWGSPEILSNPVIKDIAIKHGRTPAQVVLRWGLDNGVCAIPKSFNRKRMAENIDVFGWHLTEEDHQSIATIEQKKNLDASFLCNPELGPYKSLKDVWDGEL